MRSHFRSRIDSVIEAKGGFTEQLSGTQMYKHANQIPWKRIGFFVEYFSFSQIIISFSNSSRSGHIGEMRKIDLYSTLFFLRGSCIERGRCAGAVASQTQSHARRKRTEARQLCADEKAKPTNSRIYTRSIPLTIRDYNRARKKGYIGVYACR